MGLTDRIFTRLASREAAALPQSAFLMDLSQVSSMLRLATERSLCILDEFGKGTLAADGVGLLCATLRELSGRPHPPRVVACTHFTEARRGGLGRCCWAAAPHTPHTHTRRTQHERV